MRRLVVLVAVTSACFSDAPPLEQEGTSTSAASTDMGETSDGSATSGDATSSDVADTSDTSTTSSSGSPGSTSTSADTSSDTTDTGAICSHRVFTTMGRYTGGQVGPFANASLLCAGEAEDAGLDGIWAAVISDGEGPAGAHLEICGSVYLANDGDGDPADTLVADADKWWGDHDAAIDRHADGTPVPDDATAIAWTGTNTNGTSDEFNCDDWSSSDLSWLGTIGFTNDIGAGSWIDENPTACSQMHRLYCLEQLER